MPPCKLRVLSNIHFVTGSGVFWPALLVSGQEPHWTSRQHRVTAYCLATRTYIREYTKARLGSETSGNTESPQRHKHREAGELNREQRIIHDLVINRRQNVFFTGPAGTGKSWLLKTIIQDLMKKYRRGSVAVTASTGLAAYNIGGTTLHSFAGIGLGTAPIEWLIDKIEDNRKRLARWSRVSVLIIDEISMIDCTLFDKLEFIARRVRRSTMPFGGIQIIATGDFFQLPPVTGGPEDGSPRFCFEAKKWKQTLHHTITLTKIYRQRSREFSAILNEIREGHVSSGTVEILKKLNRPLNGRLGKGLVPTELFPLRSEADLANEIQLQRLPGPIYTYDAIEGGLAEDPVTRKRLLNSCIAPKSLQLKQGAQVILIKNLSETLINGSQGVVVGFANKNTFLYGAWEHTGSNFNAGNQAPEMRLPLFPVVRFHPPDGEVQTILCTPETWDIKRWVRDPFSRSGWREEILASRTQVPLLLAWALSIHKSQGQTLRLVKVDLDNVFERGQAYVALSRATSIHGLQVLNFDPKKITAHPKVKKFYASLSTAPFEIKH